MAKMELFVGILVQPHYFDVFSTFVFFVLIVPRNKKLIWSIDIRKIKCHKKIKQKLNVV
jgi:hypothetical protein